ncbi:putative non-specific serine/threonine protein kinase [Helianthus anomalus]
MSFQITTSLILLFVSFLFGVTTTRSAPPCLDDQKDLLLALKTHLTFDSSLSTKLVGWNQSVECCANWGGVACDEAGHVTRLDLSHESIHGPIPSSQNHWEGLNRLEYLSMAYNSLTGELPRSLLTLPSLDDLDLSYNRLSGQLIDVVQPPRRLRNLDLSNNRFEGPIPGFIFKLAALSTLKLSANKFSGRLELDKFGKLTDLYALDLSYNDLTVSVSANFSLLSKLNSIMLASCNMKEVPDLKNQSRLLMLDLSDNHLSGEIPNWIWEVGNGYLRFLNLSHNKFSGLQKPYTFPFLLDVLDLHSNRLEGDIPVPPRRVYILDYSNNNFKSSIPVDFGNVLRSTLFFSVANNKLVGGIPESIRNATSLRGLNLSRNALTGPIPPLIGNLKDLQSLDLSVNLLIGSIPEELTNLTQLSLLNLSYNHLSGRIPKFQTSTELSFEGNEGLCGPPLKKTCA